MPSASPEAQQNRGGFILTWYTIQQTVKGLVTQINLLPKWDRPERIVGITRGGWIPAAMIAFDLGIHDVQAHRIQTYDATHLDPPNPEWNNRHTLFVDDIYDSGQTYDIIRGTYPEALIAIAVWKSKEVKRAMTHMRTYLGKQVPDCWVSFPWDVQPELQPQELTLP